MSTFLLISDFPKWQCYIWTFCMVNTLTSRRALQQQEQGLPLTLLPASRSLLPNGIQSCLTSIEEDGSGPT